MVAFALLYSSVFFDVEWSDFRRQIISLNQTFYGVYAEYAPISDRPKKNLFVFSFSNRIFVCSFFSILCMS